MVEVTYLVAPVTGLDQVFDVLHDWSAVGLVAPLVWVCVDDLQATDRPIEALVVEEGRVRRVSADHLLADTANVERVRVCALNRFDGSNVVAHGRTLYDRLSPLAPTSKFTLVHLVLTTIGMQAQERPLTELGWHGVLLAPEDSAAPSAARALIRENDDPVSGAMHFASGIAGILGLWAGAPVCTLDSRDAPASYQVQLCRSFLHRQDNERLESALRNSLFDTSARLPQPTMDGQSAPYVLDERSAVAATAESFVAHHGELFARVRESLPTAPKTKLTFGQAMTAFFGFIWSAMKGAPGEFVDRIKSKVAVKVAGAGQKLAYGVDSEYEVIVRGRAADGRLAAVDEIGSAAQKIRSALQTVEYREVPLGLAGFWQDFMEVGLALADGRQRNKSVAQPVVHGQPGVVRNASMVAASPRDTYVELPTHVAAKLSHRSIRPADILQTETVLNELEFEKGQSAQLSIELERTRADLEQWRNRVQLPSFAGCVGQRLVGEIQQRRREVMDLFQRMQADTNQDALDEGFAQRAKRRAVLTRIAILVTALAVILTAVLGYYEVLTVPVSLAVGVGSFVVGCTTVGILFAQGQRDLFQLLNRRGEQASEAALAARNLERTTYELERLIRAYGQYLLWATVLGAFLDQPFGPPIALPSQQRDVSGELPRAMQASVGQADEATVERFAQGLRARMFPVGWLQEPYGLLLENAHTYGTPTQFSAPFGPGRLFADEGAAPDSALAQFARALADEGVASHGGEEVWQRARQQLDAIAKETDESIAAALGLTRLAGAVSNPFEAAVLKPYAQASPAVRVREDDSKAIHVLKGLSNTTVLTQYGEPFDMGDLAVSDFREPMPGPLPGETSQIAGRTAQAPVTPLPEGFTLPEGWPTPEESDG